MVANGKASIFRSSLPCSGAPSFGGAGKLHLMLTERSHTMLRVHTILDDLSNSKDLQDRCFEVSKFVVRLHNHFVINGKGSCWFLPIMSFSARDLSCLAELYIRSAGMMLRPRLFVLNCLVELLVGSEVVQVWLVPLIPSCLAELFASNAGIGIRIR